MRKAAVLGNAGFSCVATVIARNGGLFNDLIHQQSGPTIHDGLVSQPGGHSFLRAVQVNDRCILARRFHFKNFSVAAIVKACGGVDE